MIRKSIIIFIFILVVWMGICYVSDYASAFGERPSIESMTKVTTMPSCVIGEKDKTPPSEVENLIIETIYEEGKKVRLTWKNPPEEDFEGILIVVRTDRYPETPKDYINGGKILVDLMGEPSAIQSYIHSYFDNTPKGYAKYKDPNQYYRIFTYDKTGNYSSGVKGFVLGMIM